MTSAKSFSVTVQYGEFHGDLCYESRVKEFPEISEYAQSFAEAYELALDTIDILCDHYAEKGVKCPVPMIPCDDYSGRITLRLPLTLHKKLAIESEFEGTSLNQLIVNQLYYAQGASDVGHEVEKHAARMADQIGRVLVSRYSRSSHIDIKERDEAVAKATQVYPAVTRPSTRAYN